MKGWLNIIEYAYQAGTQWVHVHTKYLLSGMQGMLSAKYLIHQQCLKIISLFTLNTPAGIITT